MIRGHEPVGHDCVRAKLMWYKRCPDTAICGCHLKRVTGWQQSTLRILADTDIRWVIYRRIPRWVDVHVVGAFLSLHTHDFCHKAARSFKWNLNASYTKPNPCHEGEGSFHFVWCDPLMLMGVERGGFDGSEWGTNEWALSMAGLCSVLLMARGHQQSCWCSM